MDLRDVMLVIHIAGAGTWLGANMIQVVVPGLAARQGAEVAAGWYRVAGQLSKSLYMPASILILITGILMVLQDDSPSFGPLFVTIGFGMIFLGPLLGIIIFDPGS